jgi:hypothetical protein
MSMADLSIKIKADFAEASKQFKELADTSDNLQGKIKKLSDDMGNSEANKLIEQQKLAAIAYKATGKEVEGLTKQKDTYERKIVSLINKGIDPASEAIQTLQKEVENTNKELAKHGKYTGDAAKGIEMMGRAVDAAAKLTLALGAAMIVMTQKTAELGDAAAKAARSVGMTAETFQELEYAAKQSGIDNLSGSLQKLNKNMASLRNGSGSLVTALKGTNDALLEQLNSAKSNEEAFDLMMKGIREAPDDFTRAEIATAAFGNAGHEMINMALSGAEGISALREEARKHGIISNESAANSEKYIDAQTRLMDALKGVQIILTDKLLPVFTKIIDCITDNITSIDDWEDKLKVAGIALVSVTAGLTTFIAVSKGHAMVTALSVAIKALMTAITGPAGIVGIAITALAAGVGALVSINANHAKQGAKMADSLIDNKNKADALLSTYNGLTKVKDLDKNTTESLINLYPSLSKVMKDGEASVNDLKKAYETKMKQDVLDEAKKFADLAEQEFKRLQEMKKASGAYDRMSMEQFVQHLTKTNNKIIKDFNRLKGSANEILGKINMEINVSGNVFNIAETMEKQINDLTALQERAAKEASKTISQKLSDLKMTEGQELNDRINQVKQFLNSRADLEKTTGKARINSIESEMRRVLSLEKLTADERFAITEAAAEAIQEIIDNMGKGGKGKENAELIDDLNERSKLWKRTLTDETLEEHRAQVDRIASAQEFFMARSELESKEADKRIEFMRQQAEIAKEVFDENSVERLAVEKALEEAITALHREENEKRKDILQNTLNATLGAIDGFAQSSLNTQKSYLDKKIKDLESSAQAELDNENLTREQKKEIERKYNKEKEKLTNEANERMRSAALAQRAVANAEAIVQTYLAANKAFSTGGGYPWGLIPMSATIAQGLANVAKINTTPIPTAETGGSFFIPDLSPRVDDIALRVSAGEKIDVTPKGMAGYEENETKVYQLVWNGKVLAEAVNDLIDSGDIRFGSNL